ncbi:hypothetical protein DPEC_G00156600 [Dallia pectoralis]|uniref:Uncharacterized protein n=1 Tax=Dallia pectoralis TaxID=75939 RepID=A0ACC2GL84_DALPE|nr:hypothetical protein DPEC_G00156600 [Dallia pectoralis]
MHDLQRLLQREQDHGWDNEDLLEPDEDAELDILEPQPPREPLAVNESSGNATRDRLAALVSGHVQDP